MHFLRRYMSSLEEVVIRTLGSLGVQAGREPGLTGVWVDGAKVCAMGVKISRWATTKRMCQSRPIYAPPLRPSRPREVARVRAGEQHGRRRPPCCAQVALHSLWFSVGFVG